MEWLDAGNGISEEAKDDIRKSLDWLREHPDEFRESLERDRREWPGKRRKAIKYIKAIERGRSAKLPDGLTKWDIDRARRDIASREYRNERRWGIANKTGTVIGIVGGIAGIVSLVIGIVA